MIGQEKCSDCSGIGPALLPAPNVPAYVQFLPPPCAPSRPGCAAGVHHLMSGIDMYPAVHLEPRCELLLPIGRQDAVLQTDDVGGRYRAEMVVPPLGAEVTRSGQLSIPSLATKPEACGVVHVVAEHGTPPILIAMHFRIDRPTDLLTDHLDDRLSGERCGAGYVDEPAEQIGPRSTRSGSIVPACEWPTSRTSDKSAFDNPQQLGGTSSGVRASCRDRASFRTRRIECDRPSEPPSDCRLKRRNRLVPNPAALAPAVQKDKISRTIHGRSSWRPNSLA